LRPLAPAALKLIEHLLQFVSFRGEFFLVRVLSNKDRRGNLDARSREREGDLGTVPRDGDPARGQGQAG